MLHDEILSVHAALGDVLGRVDPTTADLLRSCRRNLEAAADTARQMVTTTVISVSPGPLGAVVEVLDEIKVGGECRA